MFHKRKKKQRENINPQKEIMKKKVLERIKADVALIGALAETRVYYKNIAKGSKRLFGTGNT